ncbi:MAG: hypothetical protein C5B43_03210 [Verrucomicrobia bacterium]|nr:MAG: hypothetical protein C5B43_03210 [Verrucomicrobiota bacterium]
MKTKNMKILLLSSALGIISLVKCFAVEVNIQNPYKDIAIHVVTKEGAKVACKKNSKNCKQIVTPPLNQIKYTLIGNQHKKELYSFANALHFAILLKGNNQLLPHKKYNAIKNLNPQKFEEDFLLNGKNGHIVYRANAIFKDNIITSIKIKIVEATLEGVEFERNSE